MNRTLSIKKISTAVLLVLTLLISSTATSFATAPSKAVTRYEGKGKVEVDFNKRVQYKNAKVKVTDSSGNKYSAVIIDKDSDDLEFRIKNYKTGRTYKYTVSGVRVKGTSSYGSYSSKVKIPSVSSSISRSKALSIAKNHAKSKWGVSRYYDVDAEKDTYKGVGVWEVDFESGNYSYEYKIKRSNGNIMFYEREYDD